MNHEPAMLQSTTGEPMTLEGVTARGVVRGLLFELTVEQRYRNPGSKNIEAVYTFPLPFEAVLLDLDVEIGARKLSAVVVEKKEAEGRYEEAIDQGDTAIMLERAGDGLCVLNLGNLMAGETATIRYRYAQLLRFEHGSVRLAVPTVIAPRYGDPAKAGLAPHQIPTTDLAVEYPFALTIDLAGDIARGALSSPSHAIATTHTSEGVRVSLARGAFLDRDFVLNVGGLKGRSLAVVAQDGDHFVTLASFCADLPRDANELPLKVKLLVDCSGSMAGDSIEAARRALHRILAGLAPADRFAFSRFGSTVAHETNGLVAADGAHVRAASERLGRMEADLGGTEMPAALRQVFALGGTDAAADVLLITDGEMWDAGGLVAEARAAKQRVFVVGIGSAPAEGVLKRLAEASGGVCEFVAPNEDAEGAILRMFARLRAPRVERAEIAWPVDAGVDHAVAERVVRRRDDPRLRRLRDRARRRRDAEARTARGGAADDGAGLTADDAGRGPHARARRRRPPHRDRHRGRAAAARARLRAAHRADQPAGRARARRRREGEGPAGARQGRADARGGVAWGGVGARIACH